MYNFDIIFLGKIADELGFVRDTLEKVTRLANILEFLNTDAILKDSLALKGGTAINLGMATFFWELQHFSLHQVK